MITLGIGGSNHDFCAAVVEDGRIAVAIEDERIQRIKRGSRHWKNRPCKDSVEYCLQALGLTLEQFDGIYVNSDIETASPFWEEYDHKIVSHHLNHAAAAFFPSYFSSAALMVVDGRGEQKQKIANKGVFETISVGLGEGLDMNLETFQTGEQQLATSNWQYVTTNSLGWFYRTITEIIGFQPGHEGKTMALASYGNAAYKNDLLDFVEYDNEGRFFFDPYSNAWEVLSSEIKKSNNALQVRADIAASCQAILEDSIIRIGRYVRELTGCQYLCYGGGVALNGVANHRLRTEVGFKDIYVFPASGDNGLAIGAALFGMHTDLRYKRSLSKAESFTKVAYCGRQHSHDEIVSALKNYPIVYQRSVRADEELVDRLLSGLIVSVFQRGSEVGPRALGHRSILADPALPSIRSKLNRVKRRESFRPFAPVVLKEDCSEYFDLEADSPFMLEIAPIVQSKETLIGGVSHVDKSARVQTVSEYDDPLIRGALIRMKSNGRPPVLINTSFNLNGEPIVESPSDAIEAFIQMDIDALYLDGYWVEKHTPWVEDSK